MKRLFASVTLGLFVVAMLVGAGFVFSSPVASHAASLATSGQNGCITPVVPPTPTPTPVYGTPPKDTSYAVPAANELVPDTRIKCHKPPAGNVNNVHLCGALFNGHAPIYSVITCAQIGLLVTLPCAGENAFSLNIAGTDLNIAVPGAQIFKFDPSTGQSYLVGAVTGSGGEYTFVFGSCVGKIVLPTTGAAATLPGAPTGSGFPWLPFGIGFVTLGAGVALALRSRQANV